VFVAEGGRVTDKPRCRPLPPSVVEGRAGAPSDTEAEAELLARLTDALHGLPDAERTAVIASYAYDEGVVGAAVELDVETAVAHDLGLRGLGMLRAAMTDEG
jgi:DNA-directed RNA polymerase specialized sigma24 family protein